jgi:hypothetical protein
MVDDRGERVFQPVLDRLHADAKEYFGSERLRLLPVAYYDRPASHLLRARVCRNGTGAPLSHVFVKVFKPKPIPGGLEAMRQRVARDYETTRRVYTSMRGNEHLGAVPPIACYPDLLAIATEEVQGPTLLAHLQTEAAWFPPETRLRQLLDLMATAGRWIRVFQDTVPRGGDLTLDSLRAYIDHRLQRLVGEAAFTARDRERVLRYVDSVGGRVGSGDLREVAVHSDLGPGNIIVSGRRIVVLDFGMTKLGASLHDLTRLSLQTELLAVKPWFRTDVVRRLQRALVEGFDPLLDVERPLFRLLLLLHRVNHLTTLAVNRTRLPGALYNRLVSRHHRRWLASELVHRTVVQAS